MWKGQAYVLPTPVEGSSGGQDWPAAGQWRLEPIFFLSTSSAVFLFQTAFHILSFLLRALGCDV